VKLSSMKVWSLFETVKWTDIVIEVCFNFSCILTFPPTLTDRSRSPGLNVNPQVTRTRIWGKEIRFIIHQMKRTKWVNVPYLCNPPSERKYPLLKGEFRDGGVAQVAVPS
jgi:hypothetical protein